MDSCGWDSVSLVRLWPRLDSGLDLAGLALGARFADAELRSQTHASVLTLGDAVGFGASLRTLSFTPAVTTLASTDVHSRQLEHVLVRLLLSAHPARAALGPALRVRVSRGRGDGADPERVPVSRLHHVHSRERARLLRLRAARPRVQTHEEKEEKPEEARTFPSHVRHERETSARSARGHSGPDPD